MRDLLAMFALFFLCVTTFAADSKYSLADLESLGKTASYRELYDHLADIAPTQRNETWEKLVEQAASGLLAEQHEALPRWRLAQAMQRDYPVLKNSAKLRSAIGVTNLNEFEQCYSFLEPVLCSAFIMDFVMKHKDPKLALKAGSLIRRKQAAWSALAFFKIALDGGEMSTCKDPDFSLALVSALGSGAQAQVENARVVAGTCWESVKTALLDEMGRGGDIYFRAVCPLVLEKKAISGLRASRCKELAKKN